MNLFMTRYEYLCPDHGKFEIKAIFGDAPLTARCPVLFCDVPCKRVFSMPQIRFVGIGWTQKDKSHEFAQRYPDLDRMTR